MTTEVRHRETRGIWKVLYWGTMVSKDGNETLPDYYGPMNMRQSCKLLALFSMYNEHVPALSFMSQHHRTVSHSLTLPWLRNTCIQILQVYKILLILIKSLKPILFLFGLLNDYCETHLQDGSGLLTSFNHCKCSKLNTNTLMVDKLHKVIGLPLFSSM